MVHRIEVQFQYADSRAAAVKKRLEDSGFAGTLDDLFLVDAYTIDAELKKEDLEKIALMISNPVLQKVTVDLHEHFDNYDILAFPGGFSYRTDIANQACIGEKSGETVRGVKS